MYFGSSKKTDLHNQNLLTHGNKEESHIFQPQCNLKHYWYYDKLFHQYQSFYVGERKQYPEYVGLQTREE